MITFEFKVLPNDVVFSKRKIFENYYMTYSNLIDKLGHAYLGATLDKSALIDESKYTSFLFYTCNDTLWSGDYYRCLTRDLHTNHRWDLIHHAMIAAYDNVKYGVEYNDLWLKPSEIVKIVVEVPEIGDNLP